MLYPKETLPDLKIKARSTTARFSPHRRSFKFGLNGYTMVKDAGCIGGDSQSLSTGKTEQV